MTSATLSSSSIPQDSVLKTSQYSKDIQDICYIRKRGPLNVKVINKEFVPCTLIESIQAYGSAFIAAASQKKLDFQDTQELLREKIDSVNQVHRSITEQSPYLNYYFTAASVVEQWNKQSENFTGKFHDWFLKRIGWTNDLKIDYSDSIQTTCEELPEDLFTCYMVNEKKLPLVITPKDPDITFEAFIEWLEGNQETINSVIEKYGAILFRGFPVKSSENFATMVETALGKKLLDYLGGEGSRDEISHGVFSSTKAAPNYKIPLHNELSCSNNPPTYICFYCENPPIPGTGQTILGSTRELTELLRETEAWKLFENRNIAYVSRHPPEGSFFNLVNETHKTVKQVFKTTDHDKIEEICKDKGYRCKFIGDWVEVTRIVPSMRPHPDHSNEKMWFNQAHLYHMNPRLIGSWVNYILFNILYCKQSTRNYKIGFEDGTQIPTKVAYQIHDSLDAVTVAPEWKKGDVSIVHNINTMHGRNPSPNVKGENERVIRVSMVP